MTEKMMNGKGKYIVLFLLGAIFITGYCKLINIQWYPCDAGNYLRFAQKFNQDGFSFSNYNSATRGYLLPFIYYVIDLIQDIVREGTRIFLYAAKGFTYSYLFIILVPWIIQDTFQIKMNLVARMLLFLVALFFFKGLVLYTLSDLLAITLSFTGLHLIHVLWNRKLAWHMQLLVGIAIGMLLGGAYYVRPVYLIVLILAIGILVVGLAKRKWSLLAMIVGFCIVATPQVIINSANFGTYSPFIQTKYDFGDKSLYLEQLSWGFGTQRYETNLDEENESENGEQGLWFRDEIGERILTEEGIESFDSYGQYIGIVLKHFPDVCCIYMRHLFNGMDIVYNEIYIFDLLKNRFWIQLMDYILLYIGICGVVTYGVNIQWKKIDIWILIGVLLPVLLCIPTCVETRFFAALSMVLFALACHRISLGKLRKLEKKDVKYIVRGAFFVMVCFCINSAVFASMGIPLW